MEITYISSNVDAAKAYLEFRKFKIGSAMRRKSIIETFITCLIVFIVATVIINDQAELRRLFIFMTIFIIFDVLFGDYYSYVILLAYAKIKKENKYTKTVTLGDKTICFNMRKGSIDDKNNITNEILYSEISHIQLSKSYIGIFNMSNKYFAVIPIRTFTNQEEQELFMSLLKRNTELEIEQVDF